MPERIQRRRIKGWRMPAGAIYVGRPTKWGNPWGIGADGLVLGPGMFFSADPDMTQQMIVAMYADWLELGNLAPALMTGGKYLRLVEQRQSIIEALPDLRGHDLACWCPLDQPCHADVLLELANG
jgi:hypothetical protein